ncbi:MAG: branched-chain amino acid ABC transporter permease [Thermodesulfobacteriota bacterium]|jgi:branched-chain amino acid transport system permease protein
MFGVIQIIVIYTFIMGSLYLLISLGFSVVCGVLRIFHLGYGLIFVVAVYATWMLMKEFGLGLIPAIAGMFVIQCLFSLGVIYFPIVRKYSEREEILLTALLLVAMLVEEAANYKYPVLAGVYIPTTIIPGALKIGATTISHQMLIAAGIAILVTVLFVIYLLKSRWGMVMRAMSQDINAAQLMGADVGKTYAFAMILSIIPPTLAILVMAPFWSTDPQMGWPLLEIAILVSVLGGLGNIKGTLLASYIVGFIVAIVGNLIDPRLTTLAMLLVVVIALIFKPEGIARSESLW